MLDPITLYTFIKEHVLQIAGSVLAVVGFALRLRGMRKQSTAVIFLLYFLIYVLPAILRRI